jgi:hypothetical protein
MTLSLVTLVTMPASRLRALTEDARLRSRSGWLAARLGVAGQSPGLDPPADGVVADAQHLGDFRNSVTMHAHSMPHSRKIFATTPASAETR